AQQVQKPVLLFSSKSEADEAGHFHVEEGSYGIFESARILKMHHIGYHHMPACTIRQVAFEKNYRTFVSACAVVKYVSSLRVLHIASLFSQREALGADIESLYDKFGVSVVPVSPERLKEETDSVLSKQGADWAATIAMIRRKMDCSYVSDEVVGTIAAMKLSIQKLCLEYDCSLCAVECEPAVKDLYHLYPCVVGGLLVEEGIGFVCNGDLHGALAAGMLRAASVSPSPIFMARFQALNPEMENSVLLRSCGCAPVGIVKEGVTPVLSAGENNDGVPGRGFWRIRDGMLTMCRVDVLDGEYRILTGQMATCEGPESNGTYAWVRTEDWMYWQEKLLQGGFVPNMSCAYGSAVPALYLASKYMKHMTFEAALPTQGQIEAWLRQ
ncbi:MAG: hypothetical protein J6L88_04945, partial [Clostridia bacterium]|nr:hypothetical protein [Clostridia bacterium]